MKGYYSFDVGSWHIVALNSECWAIAGGCDKGSPQETWLRTDLAMHPTRCTIGYLHTPVFSSGSSGNADSLRPLWKALEDAGAELILSGHDHGYERFAPQTSTGAASASGIRQFIVGTGGASHGTLQTIQSNSEVRNYDTFGVLKLTLHPGSYDWQFAPEAGKTFTDAGSGSCG